MTSLTTFDALKGAALVCTFLGFLALCAALVHWHDKTWKIAVEPTKASVFRVGARSSAPLGDGQKCSEEWRLSAIPDGHPLRTRGQWKADHSTNVISSDPAAWLANVLPTSPERQTAA